MDVGDGNFRHDETVRQLATDYASHDRFTTPIQYFANNLVRFMGRPDIVTTILVLIFVWVFGNYLLNYIGMKDFEDFPFPKLEFVATIAAFVVTLLILTTQRHEDELSDKRSKLTLQIALLNEKKVSKIIELLEQQRQDNPLLTSRVDHEAQQMAKSSDNIKHLFDVDK